MRYTLIAATLAVAVLSSQAMAADMTAKGKIKSMDSTKCSITLVDGKVYQFAPKCDFSKLKANESVAITYTVKGKFNVATKVAAA